MKVFVSEKNDNQYETAVCPECVTLESLEDEKGERQIKTGSIQI